MPSTPDPAASGNVVCPECGRDVSTWLTRQGTIRRHSRPSPIPGGIASAPCPGKTPAAPDVPDWIREAYERGDA